MIDADLQGINLSGAELNEACLRGSNLQGANFKGAKLSAADLKKTNLSGANFEGAYLMETKFKGTDLRQVLNLSPDEIATAFIDEKTRIPDYLEVTWTSEDTFDCKLRSKDSA